MLLPFEMSEERKLLLSLKSSLLESVGGHKIAVSCACIATAYGIAESAEINTCPWGTLELEDIL